MRQRKAAWITCVLTLFMGIRPSRAQTAAEGMPAATVDALHAMTQMAAVIFAGRVVAIRQPQRAGGAVEIEFAVEDAIRGVSGGTYVLREWGGLWSGAQMFHVEQRYLMLLHGPGPAGLSSPVGGADGAIPILGEAGVAAGLAADGRVVDLRWVETRAMRAVSYAEKLVALPATQMPAVRADVGGTQTDVTLATPGVSAIEQGVGYSAVIGLLRGWERDAAR